MLLSLAPLVLALSGLLPGQDADVPDRASIADRIEALAASDTQEAAAEAALLREALQAIDRESELSREADKWRSDIATADSQLAEAQADLTLHDGLASPQPPPGASLAELVPLLEAAELERDTAERAVAELERTSEARRTRAEVLPEQLARAQAERTQLAEELPSLDATARRSARGVRLRAELAAHEAEIDAISVEQSAIDALRDVLKAKTLLAERRLEYAGAVESMLLEAVAEARRAEAAAGAEEARKLAARAALELPQLAEIIARVEALAGLRTGEEGLVQRIEARTAELRETEALVDEVDRRFKAMQVRLDAGGLTEGLGRTLRRDYAWLPGSRSLDAFQRARAKRRSNAELLQLDLQEERESLADPGVEFDLLIEGAEFDELDEAARAQVRDALRQRRERLDAAIKDAVSLVNVSYALGRATDEFVAASSTYRDSIEQKILWVRSVGPNPFASFLRSPADAAAIAFETDWPDVRRSTIDSYSARPLAATMMIVAAVILLAVHRALRRRRRALAGLVRSYRTDRFSFTVQATLVAFAEALPAPLVLLALSRVWVRADTEFARAAGDAVRQIGWTLLALSFTARLLAADGVADAHFRWPSKRVRAMLRALRWFTPTAVLLGLLILVLDGLENRDWDDSVGRVAFICLMIATSIFIKRTLDSFEDDGEGPSQRALIGRTAHVWTKIVVALPVALAVACALGYSYTALRFEESMRASILFGAALFLVHSLLQRWLFITRRRLAVEQARQRAQARGADGDTDDGSRETTPLDEERVSIPALDAQTRQLFHNVITVSAVVGLFFLWSNILPALRGLDRIQLLPRPAILEAAVASPEPLAPASAETNAAAPGVPVAPAAGAPGDGLASNLGLPATLTLADLSLAILFGILALIAARQLPGLLELTVLRRLPLDAGARFAATTILRYLIAIIGISAVSSTLGLGWSQIQWLAAALTFGLAFGLQEIFANFVSGLIILLERPVRVGDIVTVGGTDGRVTRLRMRATTVQDWDRREYLIPNKEFITGTVINWTLSDPVTRVVIPVGVAYGSDTRKARELLVNAAVNCQSVLHDPLPQAIFRAFGESTLDLELRVFIAHRDDWPVVTDALHTSIDEAFRAEGVEIAFPQRDLHVRSVDPEALKKTDS